MASRLNPYITFSGNCREAMEFYETVFGGQLNLNTFGDFGAADGPDADKIMHAELQTDEGLTLMASDTAEGMEVPAGSNISISLSGDDAEQLRGYWDKLSSDGNVTMPLEKQMWGDEFGMVTDKFGIAWMVDIGEPED